MWAKLCGFTTARGKILMIKCSLLPCISLFLVMHFEEWKIEFSILCCLLKLNLEVIEASWTRKGTAKGKRGALRRLQDSFGASVDHAVFIPAISPFCCLRNFSWNLCLGNQVIHWKIHSFQHSLWINNTFGVYRRHRTRAIRNGFSMDRRLWFFCLKILVD